RGQGVVQRPGSRMDQAPAGWTAVPGRVYLQPIARHHVRGHGRRGRRLEPERAGRAVRERLLALSYAASRHAQRQLPPPVPCGAADAIVPRNAFFAHGVKNVDLGLYKNFSLRRSVQRLMLRVEGYNVFNRVQFGFPTTDINSATFGRILSTSDRYSPRTVQLAV